MIIEIEPREKDIEKLEKGYELLLRPEDVRALQKLRQIQEEDAEPGWYPSFAFCDTGQLFEYLWPYLSYYRDGVGTTTYRLNYFGEFVLDLIDGTAYIRIDTGEEDDGNSV